MTTAADTRNYYMSLYPIPLCESVPEELRQIIDHPIFSIDELTQEVVNRRAYYVNDSGDTAGARMTFGVLYGEVLVEVTTKGVSPEWLYEKLNSLKSDTPKTLAALAPQPVTKRKPRQLLPRHTVFRSGQCRNRRLRLH